MFHLFFLQIIFFIITQSATTRKEAFWSNPNSPKVRIQRNLVPQAISEKYDANTAALEIDGECMKNKSISDPNVILGNLLNEYPCLSSKEPESTIFYYHGNIYRSYLNINTQSSTCLANKIINWNDYCIHDITYDVLLSLYNVVICASDILNTITYPDLTIKPFAWHLDVIDKNKDGVYSKPSIELGDGNDHGIDIWILDGGVNSLHNEFIHGQVIDEDTTFDYSNKHGTAAASCASGINYGTSKGFNIHDYPVCRSSEGCSFNDIDAGLHKALNHMTTTGRRSVINLSLGSNGAIAESYWGRYYDALFNDINIAGGIIVVSSGNDNADACSYWFSFSDKVISVGAHDNALRRASYSNYGPCVDIYAPGTSIPVAYSETDINAVGYMSGTSFASPLVAGIVTNLLYEDNTRTRDEIVSILQSNSYPISNCPSGYCVAASYQCEDTTTTSVDNKLSETTTNPTTVPTPSPTLKPTSKPSSAPTTPSGCCISMRHTPRLDRFCKSLSIDECATGRNQEYCYVDSSDTSCKN